MYGPWSIRRAPWWKNDVGNLAYLHESGASGRCATNQTGKKITDLPSTLIARDGYSSDRCTGAEPLLWQFGPPTRGGRPFTKSGRFK